MRSIGKLRGVQAWIGLVSFFSACSTALGQAGFGFLQEAPSINSGYGYNAWTNGFSQAMVQLPQFQQSPNSAPQLAPMRRAFQLGAYLNDTLTGVEVSNVVPGSVARENGIEAGDTIVAVAGYQVGYVNDRRYDVVEEIQKRMDPLGRVNLLVLSRRQGRLVNIQLDGNVSSSPMISGQAILSERVQLPPGSILRVELKNVTRPFAQVGGGSDLRSINGMGPYAFEIHYDQNYIDPRDRYRLVATVTSYQGQLLMEGYVDIPTPSGRNESILIQLSRPQVVTASGVTSVGYRPDASAIVTLFRQIFQRDPDPLEMQGWTDALSRGTSLEGMRAELLASRQFFDMCLNDNGIFIQRLVQTVQGRSPSQSEVASLLNKLALYNNSKLLFVRDYLASGR